MYTLARRNKQHRVLDVIMLDRGKKHYWGDLNGDYGFVSSEDRRQMRKLRQTNRKFYHQRHHTQGQINPQQVPIEQEGYQLYHDLANSSIKPIEPKQSKKKLQISNNLQIHLPPISKTKLEANRQGAESPQNRNSIRQEYKISINNKPRVKTQTAYYQQQGKKKKIRFTPTFICSLGNPMPTYKLYPNAL